MRTAEDSVLEKILNTQKAYADLIQWNFWTVTKFKLVRKMIHLQKHRNKVDLELHRLNCLRKYLPKTMQKKVAEQNQFWEYFELYHMALKLDLVTKKRSYTRDVY